MRIMEEYCNRYDIDKHFSVTEIARRNKSLNKAWEYSYTYGVKINSGEKLLDILDFVEDEVGNLIVFYKHMPDIPIHKWELRLPSVGSFFSNSEATKKRWNSWGPEEYGVTFEEFCSMPAYRVYSATSLGHTNHLTWIHKLDIPKYYDKQLAINNIWDFERTADRAVKQLKGGLGSRLVLNTEQFVEEYNILDKLKALIEEKHLQK